MKKAVPLLLVCALLLAGCAAEEDPWADGAAHFEDVWTAETPADFTPRAYQDILAADGLYYAAWSQGEARDITNEDGQSAQCYEAEIYLLLERCGSEEKAQAEVQDWVGMEQENFQTGEIFQSAGYTVLPLLSANGENPYAHGAAAFSAQDEWAVSVEVLGMEDVDVQSVLEEFLQGLHYGEE